MDPDDELEEEGPRKWWHFKFTKTPCLVRSLLYGIIGGLSVGTIHYMRRGVTLKAYDYGLMSFAVSSISAWGICRYSLAIKRHQFKKALLEGNKKRDEPEGEAKVT
ncbi:uncharacterized protein [Dysidea avara]|uniref:uncharacterized protein n=1 Tax=Dysidea avara TaxID=196820 RepID=UPI00331A9AAF